MEPKKLARLLIDRGLIERLAVDQVLINLRAKETLADRLVADGLLNEADLLRAVAQETKTRFVSSPRLADLKVPLEVLEYIPLEAAQEHDALPIAADRDKKALAVIVADPSRLSALDKLPRVARMNQLTANVALPGAIRAAIRRLYVREPGGAGKRGPRVAGPRPLAKCPQCDQPYYADQLECGGCGLLLNADARVERSDPRIVRTLLSVPTGTHRAIKGAHGVHEGPTRLGFAVQVSDEQVPELIAGLDIARSLAEFDAFLVSFVDGTLTVGALSQATGLMSIEVRSAVASLTERKVLRLRDPPEPRADPTQPGPPGPPVVPGTRLQETKEPASPARGRSVPLQDLRHPSPDVQMKNSLQHALALERRGQATGAISVLRTAIARAPSPAPLYNRLALVILNQRRDARQAEELLHKALELEPENAVYQENLAKVLMFAAVNKRR